MTQHDALIRLARFPEIPWPRIVGMRNEIIHGYSTVDFEIVLKTVRDRLPQLIDLLEAALKKGG